MDVAAKDTGRGTRWVCPSDRHLALRAKLRTGWSVKTGTLDSRWTSSNSYSGGANRCTQSFVLTEEEQQRIIQVIRRAEALDLSEQERIGKLVERLENMKRNVCVVTTTRMNERKKCSSRCYKSAHCVCSCALCGEKFGTVLGASAHLCKDCRKYVCEKCGIETTELNATVPSPSNGSTRERTEQRTTMQRIVGRSRGSGGGGQRQYLCRICAETREMWKKSGAWFIKGMPKYILPEKKERGWSRSAHRTSTWTIGGTSRSLETAEPQDSSSDEEATRRLSTLTARGQSHSFSSLQRNQDNFAAEAHSTVSNLVQSTGGTPSFNRKSSSSSSSVGQRLSPLTNSREEDSDRLDRSTLSIPSQCSRIPPTPTSPRSRISPKASIDSQMEQQQQQQQQQQRVSFEDEILDEKSKKPDDMNDLDGAVRKLELDACNRSKTYQVQSVRSNSTITVPTTTTTTTTTTTVISTMERVPEQIQTRREISVDQEKHQSCPEQEKLSLNHRGVNSQIDLVRQQIPENVETKQENYGTLQVSLRYDPLVQCLQCKVERAQGLRPMDIYGLADPFCKLNVLPVDTVTTTKRLRTKTVHKTRNPEFNETLNFYGITEVDMWNGKALHVLILQDDPAGQDFLGEAKFPLHELQPCQTKRYKLPLQDHYPVDNEETAWGLFSGERGQIQVSLSYCTRRRALMVTVHRATNLLPMDSNGFSDPFVKLCLLGGDTAAAAAATNNHQRFVFDHSIVQTTAKRLMSKRSTASKGYQSNFQSTSIKKKTLDPEWNEEFAFPSRLTDLMNFTLCLTVWDKDFGKRNDYLGGLELNCKSTGARLRHWIDAMKFPDHRHRAWHNLVGTTLLPG